MADDPGKKSIAIDGNVVGELFATLENSDDVVAALRARMAYVGVSYGVVEELADMPEGAIGKYLAPLQVKRLSITSLLRISRALGVRAVLYVDAALSRKMQRQWIRRDLGKVHARRLPTLGQAQLKRILKPAAAELGRRGGRARQAMLSAEQRREIGRLGAQRRWHKPAAVPDQP
jgi:hypothetical protein